jgi:hypothetical protein
MSNVFSRACPLFVVFGAKLLRPDLYHGEPCLGGDPWTYIGFLNYYECIIPG